MTTVVDHVIQLFKRKYEHYKANFDKMLAIMNQVVIEPIKKNDEKNQLVYNYVETMKKEEEAKLNYSGLGKLMSTKYKSDKGHVAFCVRCFNDYMQL